MFYTFAQIKIRKIVMKRVQQHIRIATANEGNPTGDTVQGLLYMLEEDFS